MICPGQSPPGFPGVHSGTSPGEGGLFRIPEQAPAGNGGMKQKNGDLRGMEEFCICFSLK